jgi:hypothetical protein
MRADTLKKNTRRYGLAGCATMPPEEPRASKVSFVGGLLVVALMDGREIRVPLEWFPLLRDATLKQLRRVEIGASGWLLHWPALDEDLSVAALLARPCSACAHRSVVPVRSVRLAVGGR